MNNFIKCGITGWCLEIIWTAFNSFRRREMKLIGSTSVLMFPIYGFASFIKPVYSLIKNKNVFIRGIIYTVAIFFMEYITGTILKKRKICPWDYSMAKFNLNGVIRLDYAPLWFLSGLLFEKITVKNK